MKKIVSVLLVIVMLASLCACGQSVPAEPAAPAEPAVPAEPAAPVAPPESEPVLPEVTDTDIPEEIPEASATDLSTDPINIMVLNGTTGFGMAKLMNDAASGVKMLNYNISVETDASNITAALINGSVDIAALPTNAASVVYNKSEGGVQLLALNTLGVLYVVANGETENISSLADLEGKTVYAPAQNPSFIFQCICSAAGVNVTIDNTYAQPADLRTAVAAGEVDIAVLPEPMVTIAKASNDKLVVALDLTAEWAAHFSADLVQGCLVVRREFAEAHAAELAVFLKDYEASIAFLSEDIDAAAEMIVAAGIFAQAPVAKKAIPNCNLCFIAGEDMIAPMGGFLEAMLSVAPQSIGGAVPADDFYYLG